MKDDTDPALSAWDAVESHIHAVINGIEQAQAGHHAALMLDAARHQALCALDVVRRVLASHAYASDIAASRTGRSMDEEAKPAGFVDPSRPGFDEWCCGMYRGLQLAIAQAAWDAATARRVQPLTDAQIDALFGAVADAPRAHWLRQAAFEIVRKTERAHGIT